MVHSTGKASWREIREGKKAEKCEVFREAAEKSRHKNSTIIGFEIDHTNIARQCYFVGFRQKVS